MMGQVSSDTNIWIDFDAIDSVSLPFRLPCTYVMWKEAVEDEIKSPNNLKDTLLEAGLVAVEITAEEFFLADRYGDIYLGLSVYDAVALAIAKSRLITLATGDLRLRKAANKEGVPVIGTIGILDLLRSEGLVDINEYNDAIQGFLKENGGVVRLPEAELKARLSN